jgi:hypothetical protein
LERYSDRDSNGLAKMPITLWSFEGFRMTDLLQKDTKYSCLQLVSLCQVGAMKNQLFRILNISPRFREDKSPW